MLGSFTLRTDGGARGNPGPAGAGFVIEDASGAIVRSGGRYLGVATNNVAEYEALVWGLQTALDHGIRRIEVRADSELVVRQVNGHYKVKNAGLIPLHKASCELLKRFESARVMHVRREENVAADDLANRAMDARETIGDGVAPGAGGQTSLFG
ncbi:MAG: ribonuclease HI family protein [Coriobacteriia bacterium]|nr:ribonuclease HI family protein [Coriobacteriia bacterium]